MDQFPVAPRFAALPGGAPSDVKAEQRRSRGACVDVGLALPASLRSGRVAAGPGQAIATNRLLSTGCSPSCRGLRLRADRGASATVAAGVFLIRGAQRREISLIFLIYTTGSIASTFFVAGGTFAAMSVYGLVTRRDLSGMGAS